MRTFTGRLRPELGVGPRARLRRARSRPSACRTCSRPSTTRWCCKPATWSACCRELRLAPRGPARRPVLSELLRGAARRASSSRSCSRAPAATSCSPAIRGATTARSSTTTSTHYVDKYYDFWQRLVPTSDRAAVLRAPMLARGREHRSARRSSAACSPAHARRLTRPEDYVNPSLYFEAKTFLHGLLVVEDKLSMAHGLETRVPFLDNDLVDFAMRVPVRLKLRQPRRGRAARRERAGPRRSATSSSTRDGKLLLREVMARYVPDDDHRAATSRASRRPDASWFRGESIDYVRRAAARPRRAASTSSSTATTVQRAGRRAPRRARRTAGC